MTTFHLFHLLSIKICLDRISHNLDGIDISPLVIMIRLKTNCPIQQLFEPNGTSVEGKNLKKKWGYLTDHYFSYPIGIRSNKK